MCLKPQEDAYKTTWGFTPHGNGAVNYYTINNCLYCTKLGTPYSNRLLSQLKINQELANHNTCVTPTTTPHCVWQPPSLVVGGCVLPLLPMVVFPSIEPKIKPEFSCWFHAWVEWRTEWLTDPWAGKALWTSSETAKRNSRNYYSSGGGRRMNRAAAN